MLRVLFSPRLLGLHAAAVVAVAVAVLLGLWQYGVWQGHRSDKASALAHTAPVPLSSVLGPDSPFPADGVGRPVRLTGRWMPSDTLFVSGRRSDGRTGVWAVTPVAACRAGSAPSCADASAILVVRGWAPSVAAVPGPPRGQVRVQGWLQPGEGASRPDPDPSDRVLTALRVPDAIAHVDRDLYGGYVIAKTTSPPPAGVSRPAALTAVTPQSLPQPSEFTGLRNLLYAFQWWVFGGFAMFLWWRWTRDTLDRHEEQRTRDREPEPGPDESDGRPTPVGDAEVTSRT